MIITIKKIRPYVKVLSFAAVIAAGAYLYFFVNDYFYPALTGSQTVLSLQKNIAAQAIDVSKFNNLLEAISQKTSLASVCLGDIKYYTQPKPPPFIILHLFTYENIFYNFNSSLFSKIKLGAILPKIGTPF